MARRTARGHVGLVIPRSMRLFAMAQHATSVSRLAILGGDPHCNTVWAQWPIHDEAEEKAVLGVLRSGAWWYGEKVAQFEREFADFQGAKYGVSCTNGTTALEMALRAVGVVPGDEVIVPPYSFIATASAVITVGAVPIFADIDPGTLCLDPQRAAAKVSAKTKAIIPVHVGGRIADMEAINRLADSHGLKVIEDAAHAWGSQCGGRGAGTLGDCGTFSFQVSKNLTAGEGGILVTDDEELADLCRSFSHCGRTKGAPWYDHNHLGSNLRLTEFQGAILSAQLSRLPSQVDRRARSAAILDEALADVAAIALLEPAPEMSRRSYHFYAFRLRLDELKVSRKIFLSALQTEGVPATDGWYRPLYHNGLFGNSQGDMRHGIKAPLAGLGVDYSEVDCPVAEEVCRDAVWLPQNLLLAGDRDIERVAEAIRKVANGAPSLQES